MKCMIAVVDVLCPEQHDAFKANLLSAITATYHVED